MSSSIEPRSDFWKFREVDERFIQALNDRKLWFASPQFFNDPFDCQVDIEETFQQVRSHLRNDLDEQFSKIISSVEMHVRRTRYAYLCVCKDWRQTLMWSHYGNNHRGAALGFTFDPSGPFRLAELTFGDVIYKSSALSDQISSVNEAFGMSRVFRPGAPGLMWGEGLDLTKGFYDSLIRLYDIVRFMKAECWKYEEEFRFESKIEDSTAKGVSRSFAPKDLKHVLFGAHCSDAV